MAVRLNTPLLNIKIPEPDQTLVFAGVGEQLILNFTAVPGSFKDCKTAAKLYCLILILPFRCQVFSPDTFT